MRCFLISGDAQIFALLFPGTNLAASSTDRAFFISIKFNPLCQLKSFSLAPFAVVVL